MSDIAAESARPAAVEGALPALSLAALGVVFGDIGTSPLYTLKTVLDATGPHPAPAATLGALSLIVWTLVIVTWVKYVAFAMRVDNDGEGGILALMSLLGVKRQHRPLIVLTGLFGAALIYGDGAITPAISVLSALEGLDIVTPALHRFVLPMTVVILVALFAVQRQGTARIGRLFGPVMAVWFAVIAVLGLYGIAQHPTVLLALDPRYGLRYLASGGGAVLAVLGGVFLCVTGAEALYADMGHFGVTPIRRSWTFFVLPTLVLNYFGQGAAVISDPAALHNPFFLLAPHWLQLPLVVLATAATVIASQAVISGAYSMTRQCMQLGFLPRMTVVHTSSTERGQIFVPQVNLGLMVGVLVLVLAFKTSDSLASAYGIAVTGTFLCTCVLAAIVFRRQFKWSRGAAMGLFGSLFLVDLIFFSANTVKIVEGGWVPLAMGLGLMALMTSWKRGRDLLLARWQQDSLPLAPFLARLPQSRSLIRVPGMAIFLTGNPDYVPTSLLHNLKHNKVLHEQVLFVTVQNLDVPEARTRMQVEELAPGMHRVVLRYGFMESPNIPRALEDLSASGVKFDPMQASYFLGREVMVPSLAPKMALWRRWLFLVMARNAVPATEFFRIPYDRVVELGVRVAI